ncbi:DNA methyltransferase [Metamycoplasma hyosynoviae]|uniref:DNA methyltransferase n=1 Tax=Metamycoplasma hyosynoviae TaxID=29559 RepID=UPI0023667650|nr:DNA methyltransferase [Metamycoplasma hyosynoviae]MDD7884159.1 DNA methyltransferase [Metamycoplasma hyosynoviae]
MKNIILIYEDIDKKNLLSIDRWPKVEKVSINSISSYLAMFPENIPKYFIEKYSEENDWVMDNFSGRGTTAVTCRQLKRRFVGNDLSPYAFILTRAKISANLFKKDIKKRIIELEFEFNKNHQKFECKDEYQLHYFYHNNTLNQLLFLRNKLGKNWKNNNDIDNIILVLACGLMHGRSRKDGSTMYFSLDMPNTISFSPEYVNKYSKAHNLVKPNVNIFEKLLKRLETKYSELLSQNFESNFKEWDSTSNFDFIENETVSLVITSPPYLSIVNYTASNWLRLWLLGFDRAKLKNEIVLSDNLKISKYQDFLITYLQKIYSKLKTNAKVCLVIGDVHKIELIEQIWKQIKDKVQYKFLNLYVDNNVNDKKITKMLNTKKGNATKIDKILVLEKN